MKKTPISKTIVTIGTFDGVHVGHQKILQNLVKLAKETTATATVLTLFPHPRMVLHQDDSIKLLNTIEERVMLIKDLGVKQVVVKTFDSDFANLSAKDYVKSILVDELQVTSVIIGYDHHFGKGRTANIEDLKKFGKEFDFDVIEIPAQDINEVTVSSTKIREALHKGNIKTANKYLGYQYFINGLVVPGKKIGRTISFPTANLEIEEAYKLIPKDGVYIVRSEIDHTMVYGMMNIGSNPTIPGKNRTIEIHYFDFNKDIYSKKLTVFFIERLRDEIKFESVDALKKQLLIDEKQSRKFISKN